MSVFSCFDGEYSYDLRETSTGWYGSREKSPGWQITYSPINYGLSVWGQSLGEVLATASDLNETADNEGSVHVDFRGEAHGVPATFKLLLSTHPCPHLASYELQTSPPHGTGANIRVVVTAADAAGPIDAEQWTQIGDHETVLRYKRDLVPILPGILWSHPMIDMEGTVVDSTTGAKIRLGKAGADDIDGATLQRLGTEVMRARQSIESEGAAREVDARQLADSGVKYLIHCGAVATWLYLLANGTVLKIDAVSDMLPTHPDGLVSVAEIQSVVSKFGPPVKPKRLSWRELKELKRPTILLTPKVGTPSHFLLLQPTGDALILRDPKMSAIRYGDVPSDSFPEATWSCVALVPMSRATASSTRETLRNALFAIGSAILAFGITSWLLRR